MVFDELEYEAITLKVRRPTDLDVADFKGMLLLFRYPPLTKDVDDNSLHTIYIRGLRAVLTKEQIRELLESFGDVKRFHLVQDGPTNMSEVF